MLIGALGNTHDDVPTRIEETIEANGNQAFDVKIVPLLQHSLDDPNPKVRGASAVTLSTILAAHGPAYCNSYIDDFSKIRPWADWKGPPPDDLVLDIAKVLNSVDRDKIPQILSGLCGLGPPAKVAIPYLLPLLRDQDGPIRFGVLFDLSEMGPAACAAIPDAMRSLKDPDKGVRLKAMAVLGVCGPAAKEAVPELAIALKSTDHGDCATGSAGAGEYRPESRRSPACIDPNARPQLLRPRPQEKTPYRRSTRWEATPGPQFLH